MPISRLEVLHGNINFINQYGNCAIACGVDCICNLLCSGLEVLEVNRQDKFTLSKLFRENNHDPILKAGENMLWAGASDSEAMLEMVKAYHSEREVMLNEVLRLKSFEVPKGIMVDKELLSKLGVKI